MSNTINLDEKRPHLVIECDDNVHVLPVSVFQDVIDGKMSFTDIECHEDLIKPILKGFLNNQ